MNAFASSVLVTLANTIVVSDVQFSNADSSTVVKSELALSITLESPEVVLFITVNDVQPLNASFLIVVILLDKTTVVSDVQPLKAYEETNVKVSGSVIDVRPLFSNTPFLSVEPAALPSVVTSGKLMLVKELHP